MKFEDNSKWTDECQLDGQVDKQLIDKAVGLLTDSLMIVFFSLFFCQLLPETP